MNLIPSFSREIGWGKQRRAVRERRDERVFGSSQLHILQGVVFVKCACAVISKGRLVKLPTYAAGPLRQTTAPSAERPPGSQVR